MSYGVAAALQSAVYARLSGDAALAALVGTAVFDVPPAGVLPDLYVVLGAEDVRDRSDAAGAGAAHDIRVTVVAAASGFMAAKQAAAAVSDALVDADLALDRGYLVSLQFLRAEARQGRDGASRRIELRFRARVGED